MWALKLQDPVVQGYLLGIIEILAMGACCIFIYSYCQKRSLNLKI